MLQGDTAGKFPVYVNVAALKTSNEIINSITVSCNKVRRRMDQLELQPSCMTEHPGMDPVCFNIYSLQNASNIYKADYGPLRLRGVQK